MLLSGTSGACVRMMERSWRDGWDQMEGASALVDSVACASWSRLMAGDVVGFSGVGESGGLSGFRLGVDSVSCKGMYDYHSGFFLPAWV